MTLEFQTKSNPLVACQIFQPALIERHKSNNRISQKQTGDISQKQTGDRFKCLTGAQAWGPVQNATLWRMMQDSLKSAFCWRSLIYSCSPDLHLNRCLCCPVSPPWQAFWAHYRAFVLWKRVVRPAVCFYFYRSLTIDFGEQLDLVVHTPTCVNLYCAEPDSGLKAGFKLPLLFCRLQACMVSW